MQRDVINSMWFSNNSYTFSVMEQLCMKSFLAHGHPFHLYLYNPMRDIPAGVVVKDAAEILPRNVVDMFRWRAQFSDLFRYTVVHRKGGWWVDMDMVCLRPFEFEAETVVSGVDPIVHNAPFKAPVDSPWLGRACQMARDKHDSWMAMDWAEIGGGLLTRAAIETGIKPISEFTFDPFQNSAGYARYVQADASEYSPEAYSLHLHHASWTLGLGNQPALDPNGTYPSTSIYETLKRRYL